MIFQIELFSVCDLLIGGSQHYFLMSMTQIKEFHTFFILACNLSYINNTMKEDDFQVIYNMQGDGGAYVEAFLPISSLSESTQIKCSFCYLDFCTCCQGCLKKCRDTEPIYLSYTKKIGPSSYQCITLFKSNQMSEEEIYKQGCRARKDQEGYVILELYNEENNTTTQKMAKSKQKIPNKSFCYAIKDEKMYILDKDESSPKLVEMIVQKKD